MAAGSFDVVDGAGPEYVFDRERGYRCDKVTGVAVCVHPFRVGLAPGRYASKGEEVRDFAQGAVFVPSPGQLELPAAVDDLEAWMVAVVRSAAPEQMASALEHAEMVAAERFDPVAVVEALRHVLTHELAG
jgi:hypothetical protein